MTQRCVRWSKVGEPEVRCGYCNEWLALTLTFWVPGAGMVRCRACLNEYRKLHERGYRADEIRHEQKLTRERMRRLADPEKSRAAQRRWKAANRERVLEYGRRYRARHREALNAKVRLYYAECRTVILDKKRAAYAERVA